MRATFAILAVVLVLALIGAAINRAGRPAGEDRAALRSDAPAPIAGSTSGGDTSAIQPQAEVGQDGAGVPADAALPAPALGGDATGATSGQAAGAPATTAQVPPALDFGRKVIRNATVGLTVQDVDQAIAYVRDAAIGAGGFVFSSSTSYQGELKHGQIVVHVPFDQFDAVMNGLRNVPGLDRIDSESTTSQDVTTEYVDTEARVRTLQATEQSYVALLDRATKVEDILLIQSHLANVRGQIETLQGRLKYLDSVTAYSTISVSIAPVPPVAAEEVAAEASANPFVRAARGAWEASLAVVVTLGAGLVLVLVFSWWLVPLGLAAYVVARRRRGRVIATPAAPTSAP